MLDHPFARHWRAGFALRARYAEDCLAQGVERGVAQYVVLGAGLDTFACRQPPWSRRLQIFELDHPATQQWKRERLRHAGIELPSNVTFVPTDFERASVADALGRTGFAFAATTLCSWMGVTQYLTRDALDATFRFTLSLPRHVARLRVTSCMAQHWLRSPETRRRTKATCETPPRPRVGRARRRSRCRTQREYALRRFGECGRR